MAGKVEMKVEVVYATPTRQWQRALVLPPGSAVRAALEACEIAAAFPELDLNNTPLGIFGEPVTLETKLEEGDRVELYRPLVADPKAARRGRAAQTSRKRRRL